MQSPHEIKTFTGLYGSINPVSGRIPEGALEVADNVVIRSTDVVEPRRGYTASASSSTPINAIEFKDSHVITISYASPSPGVGLYRPAALRAYNPANDSWLTNLNPPGVIANVSLPMYPGGLPLDRPGISTTSHTRFVSANKALFFQSRYGLVKVEKQLSGLANNFCRDAIQPPVPSSDGPLTNLARVNGAGNTIATGTTVAYRVTTCRFGANKELIESEPSARVLISNTSGTSQVLQLASANAFMTPGDAFLRIYRSKATPIGTPPKDELFLVAEVARSNPPLDVNGFISLAIPPYNDNTTDDSLGPALYTNPDTGGGFQSANNTAPLSADMAWFRERMYYLNTSDIQRLTVKITGTGTGGIVDGDWIQINGAKFTFTTNSTLALALPYVFVQTTTGSAYQNIYDTASELAWAITEYFGNAYSVSPRPETSLFARNLTISTGTLGEVLIQSLVPGTPAFTFQTSTSVGYSVNYQNGTTSDPNAQVAALSWSNVGQPEGVPIANNDLIGDVGLPGQRVIPLKEAFYVFKQDGLWRGTDDGSTLGPILQVLDPTVRLAATNSVVTIDNVIFALCDQGVIAISETGGATNISHAQIERELFKLMANAGASAIENLAFGVAYQSEHTYILSLPESPTANACTRQYVYNIQTGAWTSWTIPNVLCGAVHPDTGQLVWGRADGVLWMERKNRDATDYQDPGFTVASPATTATASLVFSGDLRSGSTSFAVGDVIQQFQATNALSQRVIAVSYASGPDQTTVTLDAVPRYAWSNAVPLTVVKAIQCAVKFLPIYASHALTDKKWDNSYLSFRYCNLDFANVSWSSEKFTYPSTAQERISNSDGSAAPITLGTWGPQPWGQTTWGRQTRDVTIKATFPTELSYASQLTLALGLPCAICRFELSAIDIKIATATDRTVR